LLEVVEDDDAHLLVVLDSLGEAPIAGDARGNAELELGRGEERNGEGERESRRECERSGAEERLRGILSSSLGSGEEGPEQCEDGRGARRRGREGQWTCPGFVHGFGARPRKVHVEWAVPECSGGRGHRAAGGGLGVRRRRSGVEATRRRVLRLQEEDDGLAENPLGLFLQFTSKSFFCFLFKTSTCLGI